MSIVNPLDLARQLDELIEMAGTPGEFGLIQVPESKCQTIWICGLAAIQRITGDSSAYSKQAEDIGKKYGPQLPKDRAGLLVGIMQALSDDLKAGYLKSVEELIHGELFGDFLEMARHLLDSGYKDAAAVIAGSSLEGHLRQLAKRWRVPVDKPNATGDIEPKKADTVNAELVKANAYSKLDQKSVTAWLDLRNKAAHGHYTEYQKEQVALMIDGIRDFITRCPA